MAADSRIDRHLQRQRGTGVRDLKSNFGFVFGTVNAAVREYETTAHVSNDPLLATPARPVKPKAPVVCKGRKTTAQKPLPPEQEIPPLKRRGRPKKNPIAQTADLDDLLEKTVEPQTRHSVRAEDTVIGHAEPSRKRRGKQHDKDEIAESTNHDNVSNDSWACHDRAISRNNQVLSRPSRAAKEKKTYNENVEENVFERPIKSHEPAVIKRRGRSARKAAKLHSSPQQIKSTDEDKAILNSSFEDNDKVEPRTLVLNSNAQVATEKPRRRGRPARARKLVEAPSDHRNMADAMAAHAEEQHTSTRHVSHGTASANAKEDVQPHMAETRKRKRISTRRPAEVPANLPLTIEHASPPHVVEPDVRREGLSADIGPSPAQDAQVTIEGPTSGLRASTKASNTRKPRAKKVFEVTPDGNGFEWRDVSAPSEKQVTNEKQRSRVVPAKTSKRKPLQARSTNTPSPAKPKQREVKTTKDEWQKQDWFKASVPSELLRGTDRRLHFRF